MSEQPGELVRDLADKIVAHLKDEAAPAGTHVTAQSIAEKFRVSRFPVGQALALLGGSGLLEHRANRGYFVAGGLAEAASPVATPATRDTPYHRLAEDHLAGRLPNPATDADLRRAYDLSAGQLSELMARIVQEGWAERRPGRGWEFLPVLTTPESLAQTLRLRLALEPAALLEPGYRLDPKVAAICAAAEHRLLAGGIDSDSAEALHERGARFHEAIVAAGGNPFILDTIRRINRVRRLLFYRSTVDRKRYRLQCQEHLEILDRLQRDRNEEASALLAEHLRHTMERLAVIGSIPAEKPGSERA